MTTITHEKHTFELVESVPKGYEIWGISMKEGYIPLCKVIKGTYNVEPDTLKAIKVDDIEGAKSVTTSVVMGRKTLKGMESYIKRYQNNKGAYISHKVETMRKAIEVMKTIKFD